VPGQIEILGTYSGDTNNDPSQGTFVISVSGTQQGAAGYSDGFEQYTAGSTCASPNPCLSAGNNQGWVASEVGTCTGATFGVIALPYSVVMKTSYNFAAYQGAQVYQFDLNATLGGSTSCAATNGEEISLNLVAISNAITITAFTYQMDKNVLANVVGGGLTNNDPVPNQWNQVSLTFGATVGKVYQVSLYCESQVNPPTYENCFFDDFSAHGAVLWNYQTNFQMVDWANKPTLYNLVAYGGSSSSVIVQYSNGSPPYTAANLTAPDLELPLSGASLVTIWVGSSYLRTIIPASSGNTTLYLDPPSMVIPYTFQLEDLTGKFGQGTTIQILSGSTVITSGYIDANGEFSADLEPGSYTAEFTNGANSYSQLVSLGSVSTVVTVPILKISIPASEGYVAAVGWSTGWAGNNLVTYYNDTTDTTTEIQYTLLQENSSGTFTIYASTYVGTWGGFENSVTSNASIANQLYVELIVTNKFGTNQLGPTAAATGSLFPQSPLFPPDVAGLDVVIPSQGVWAEVFSLIVITIFASIFGYRSSAFGFIAVTLLTAFFAAAGFLALAPALAGVTITLAVAGFLIYRQGQNPY
jgi:hypothetical protein